MYQLRGKNLANIVGIYGRGRECFSLSLSLSHTHTDTHTHTHTHTSVGRWEDRKQWRLGVGQCRKPFWNPCVRVCVCVYIYCRRRRQWRMYLTTCWTEAGRSTTAQRKNLDADIPVPTINQSINQSFSTAEASTPSLRDCNCYLDGGDTDAYRHQHTFRHSTAQGRVRQEG
jgi:hypothetical protein